MFSIIKKVRYILSLLIFFAPISSAMEDDKEIYTIVGANGQTGSLVARSLIDHRKTVRVVLHKQEQAESWQKLGADVKIADIGDKAALREALSGSHKVYLLSPPTHFYEDQLVRSALVNNNMVEAANEAGIKYVVALSSMGAHLDRGTGVILHTYDFEQKLKNYKGKSTIIRVSAFMENWNRALGVVFKDSTLPSMYVPVDRPQPFVSAIDIADVVTDCLMREPRENSIIELTGPKDYSPVDAAEVLSNILHKPIKAFDVPRDKWGSVFAAANGFPPKTVENVCEMYDAINNGIRVFEGKHEVMRGKISLEEALSKGVEAYLKNTQKASEDKK